jgi:adenylate cyclase
MRRLTRFAPLLISLLMLGLIAVLQAGEAGPFQTLRNLVFDAYQRWLPRVYEDVGVRIVDIDEESLQRLGQWPWPRPLVAELLERLQAAGARSIAFDVIFAEPDRTSPASVFAPWLDRPEVAHLVRELPDHDGELARAIEAAPVVTGFVLSNDKRDQREPAGKAGFALAGSGSLPRVRGFAGAIATLPSFEAVAAGNGALNFVPGVDGKIRRVPLLLRKGDRLLPTLAGEAVRVAAGARGYQVRTAGLLMRIGSQRIPLTSTGEIWMHYTPPVADRFLPAWRVLSDDLEGEHLDGAIVLIGTSAIGLRDLRMDAVSRIVPGVEVHAQAVEQILAGRFLVRPDWALGGEILVASLTGLLVLSLVQFVGGFLGGAFALAAVGAAFTGSAYAFAELGLLLDPLSGSLGLLCVYLIGLLSRQLIIERQRRWVQRAFASYVSAQLVEHLVSHPDQLKLGGERRECSFLLTDLSGFTPLMEALDPGSLTALINDYLDGIVDIVFKHDGMVDRFVGDAVAVIFSAPVEQPDHRCRAVACARDLDRFTEDFKTARRAEGIPFGSTRIGVHSGEVIIGNFGGRRLLDYRALGDPINTTARLESANKQMGTRVCISAATAAGCPGFEGRPVGELLLKGKRKVLLAYEPVTSAGVDAEQLAGYRRAYTLLAEHDPDARTAFADLVRCDRSDGLARFHLARLELGESGTRIVLAQK